MNTLSHFHFPSVLIPSDEGPRPRWLLSVCLPLINIIALGWYEGYCEKGLHVHYMIFIKTSALRLQFFHFFIHTCNVVILILATIYHTMICLITIKGHVSITYAQIAKLYFVCKLWKKMFILKKLGKGGGSER